MFSIAIIFSSKLLNFCGFICLNLLYLLSTYRYIVIFNREICEINLYVYIYRISQKVIISSCAIIFCNLHFKRFKIVFLIFVVDARQSRIFVFLSTPKVKKNKDACIFNVYLILKLQWNWMQENKEKISKTVCNDFNSGLIDSARLL